MISSLWEEFTCCDWLWRNNDVSQSRVASIILLFLRKLKKYSFALITIEKWTRGFVQYFSVFLCECVKHDYSSAEHYFLWYADKSANQTDFLMVCPINIVSWESVWNRVLQNDCKSIHLWNIDFVERCDKIFHYFAKFIKSKFSIASEGAVSGKFSLPPPSYPESTQD